jgi:DNA polymerase I-like protein with 3'-5' exonuclease and polymerase domains
VLKKVCGWNFRPGCKRTDTLVLCRVIHADQKKLRKEDTRRGFAGRLVGAQSLKAWGMRLGEKKADYGVDENGEPIPGAWDEWSPAMQEYMDQDCRTNLRLLQALKPWEYPRVPLELEHAVAELCFEMEQAGIPFDVPAAQELFQRLMVRRDELERELVAKYGEWQEVDRKFIAKRDDKKRGRVKGQEVTVYKTVVFNPGSRRHIEKKLREYGWTPTEFTDSGQAKLNEETLLRLKDSFPEAKLIVEYLLVQKRLGQLGLGDKGWLQAVDDKGLVHPSYHPNGTNTGRATHYDPNVSQVPTVVKPYGKEFRSLFHVPPGWKLIGADMSGLELRCLAHYLAFWDKGKYGDIVINGDVHWHHVQAYGWLPWGTELDKASLEHKKLRNDWSKRTTYAILYGAGDKKVGSISGVNTKEGGKLKANLMSGIAGMSKLQGVISRGVRRGYIKGLDGRHMPVRSDHAALNMLLQNAGAVLCKTWMVNVWRELHRLGFRHGWDGKVVFCIWAHDELQVAVREEHVETVKTILIEQARKAGEPYGFRCPLDGDATVGTNWAETH